MTSKEALERLLALARPCDYEVKEHRNSFCDMLENTINKDLDRLEELEKTIDILKNKKVNLFHIWVFDDYEQYKEHYPFSEYHAIEDMLTLEEFDLLKEVLKSE